MDLFQKISLAKRDQKTLMLLLLQFRPLIKKYARMLHMEDGIEELVATLLEAIIKCPLRANYRADYFLLSYLKKND